MISLEEFLNTLNKDFYRITSQEFSATRQHFWPGWDSFLPELEVFSEVNCLDIGCGNGRFYEFLVSKLASEKLNYLGIDFSEELVEIAKKNYPQTSFKVEDLFGLNDSNSDSNQKFNLVVLFGVMHHLPSVAVRENLFNFVKNALVPGGLFVFSTWNFELLPRLKNKIVYPKLQDKLLEKDWLQEYSKSSFYYDQLGQNDYILSWKKGGVAFRYCHKYSDLEVEKLLNFAGLKLLKTYLADAKEGQGNKYWVAEKAS